MEGKNKGDRLFAVIDNTGSSKPHCVNELEITKVGRKYITVTTISNEWHVDGFSGELKLIEEDGKLKMESYPYCWVYGSELEAVTEARRCNMYDALRARFSKRIDDTLTFDKLKRVSDILEIKEVMI